MSSGPQLHRWPKEKVAQTALQLSRVTHIPTDIFQVELGLSWDVGPPRPSDSCWLCLPSIKQGCLRGIREAAKALDKRQAHLCVLASNCDEPMYVKLVEALCAEHQINLIKVDDNKKLGEWVGLCKIDREGKPRKVVGCSCVVVKDYGKESQAKAVIEEYFKCKK
ncbi:40S ribosomal protein S12-like [Zalophus californianus]|uniref:40S ribosomal protein S12 n=1 Tax=Zalophus californianus TaxID=9704 RepID=A0A6P9FFF5_ZALCA|nr:40S ribosomal protein S12-like [Zalophus californianus]